MHIDQLSVADVATQLESVQGQYRALKDLNIESNLKNRLLGMAYLELVDRPEVESLDEDFDETVEEVSADTETAAAAKA